MLPTAMANFVAVAIFLAILGICPLPPPHTLTHRALRMLRLCAARLLRCELFRLLCCCYLFIIFTFFSFVFCCCTLCTLCTLRVRSVLLLFWCQYFTFIYFIALSNCSFHSILLLLFLCFYCELKHFGDFPSKLLSLVRIAETPFR